MRLETKKAIVTGAGGGIGRAVSEALAQQGAAVLCADINEERVNATVAAAKARGDPEAKFTHGKFSYTLNFASMQQANDETDKKRPVRCLFHPQVLQ